MFLSIGIGVKRFGSVVSGIIKKNLQAWFDFKKADVIGAELIKGGSFDSGDFGLFTVAVNGTGVVSVVSIDGGYGVRIQNPVADSSPANLNYLNALVVGETYELTYRIVDNSEGLIYIWISVPAVDFPQEVGTHTITFTVPTGSSTTLVFNRTGGGLVDITITDISLKRVSQFVKDKSPNTNKAELFTGKALEFNGNDSVVLDGFTSSGDTFTFAFWAKATASAVSYILDANSPRFVIMYNYSVLTVHSGSASVTFGAMQLNQFNRVAVVVNGTSVTAYVDGVQFGTTQTIALVDMSSITDLTLGSKYDSSTAFFSGSLSDFQIYNEAWIQSDVTFDYNNPNHLVTDNPNTTIALSNLKGYWALSEGSGSIAYDSSGGGNNGTITGATYDDQQPTIPQLWLMDWSKGSNLVTYSEDFSQWSSNNVLVSGQLAPDGTSTATKITSTTGTPTTFISGATSLTDTRSIWARTVSGVGTCNLMTYFGNGDVFNLTETWQRFDVTGWVSTGSNNFYAVDFRGTGTLTEVIVWGAQQEASSTVGSYIGTNGYAASNAMLIENPNNKGKDVLGNPLRLREGGLNSNGTGWIESPANTSLDATSELSLGAWIRFADFDASYNIILKKYGWSTTGYGMYRHASGNFFFEEGNATGNTQTSAPIEFTLNEWSQVVVTRESGAGNIKFYSNGELIKTVTSNLVDIGVNTYPLLIGKWTGGAQSGSTNFTGSLDDVFVYDKVLSPEEIKINYELGLKIKRENVAFKARVLYEGGTMEAEKCLITTIKNLA